MTELKKCPFCGCNAGVLEYRQLHGPTLYKIACNSKKCRGHDSAGNVGSWLENGWRESREEAAELWNRRAERTCRMVDNGCELCCSECDARHEYDDDPKFCMCCGAKVVSDDADR